MKLVIVTGMSGAGKSTTLRMLEDAGYYCVDNLPISLIRRFVEMACDSKSQIEKAALGVDIRSGQALEELERVLEEITLQGVRHELLYLDASDPVLVRRYKESRRVHPLARDGRVEKGIEEERRKLAFLKKYADYIIDTSQLLTRELRQELDKIFVQDQKFSNLVITVLSFGFKYGIPNDCDLVFDVRFLPNPFYIEELRNKTGNDAAVQDYVMGFDLAHKFLEKLTDMVEFLIPNYVAEGKNQLVIGIGCTGGKHRSVTLADRLYVRLKTRSEYGIKIEHRDIEK